MKSNFEIEDAVNIMEELANITYDVIQERKFIHDNSEALKSKNFFSISSRLDMTKEKYKTAIDIFSMIVNIAERVAPQPPSRTKSPRLAECVYCIRYGQQDSEECDKCHKLTHYTNFIPAYAVMQKAGEKGIEWGIDWLIDSFTEEDKAKVKREFYAMQKQQR